MAGVTTRLVWDVGTAASIHPTWDVGTTGISIGWESTQIVKKRLQTTDPRSFIVKKFLEASWSQGSEAVITITWDVGTGHHVNPKWDIINRPASFSYSFGWNQTQIVEAPVRIGYSQLGRIRRLLVTGWTPTSIRFKRLGMEWNSTIPVRHTIATTWSQLGRIPSILNAGWEQTHIQFKRFRQTWLNTIIVDKTNRYGWESTQRVPKQLNSFWTLVGQVRKFTAFAWEQTIPRLNKLEIRLAYQQIVYGGNFLRPASPAVPARPAVAASVVVDGNARIISGVGLPRGDAVSIQGDSIYLLRADGIYVHDAASPFTFRRTIPIPFRGSGLIANRDGTFFMARTNSGQLLRLASDGTTIGTLAFVGNTYTHAGLARVGNTFYVSSGPTGIVDVYEASETDPNQLIRQDRIQPPTGIINSFGFYADETYLYWIDYSGNLVVTTRDGTIAESGVLGTRVTGLGAGGGFLYAASENHVGEGGRVFRATLTITEASPARPGIPAIPERYVTVFGWPQTHIFRRALRVGWESTQIAFGALVRAPATGPTDAQVGTATTITSTGFSAVTSDRGIIYASRTGPDGGELRRFRRSGTNTFTEILPRLQLDSRNGRPWGMTDDDTFVYVAQWNSDQIFAYRKNVINDRTEEGRLPSQLIRLGAVRQGNGLARHGDLFYLAESGSASRVHVYDANWAQVDTLDFGDLGFGGMTGFDLDDTFYYISFENPRTFVIVHRIDRSIVYQESGTLSGVHVDGNTLYRASPGEITVAPLTFTGARAAGLTGIGTLAWSSTQIVEKELRATWNITQVIRRILRPVWEATQITFGGYVVTKKGTPPEEGKPATPPSVVIRAPTTLFNSGLAPGAITVDKDNIYLVTGNTLRPFAREAPFTAGTTIDLPGTSIYSGIARDDQFYWLWREGEAFCIRINHDGSNSRAYRIDTPSSLRHTGMARVGDQLYVSDGDTSTVHVYDIGPDVPGQVNTLTRVRTITAPFGSYGFWADDKLLYYIAYNGRLRIHDHEGNELARRNGLGNSVVALTAFEDTLYLANEGGGRSVRQVPLTIRDGTPAIPPKPGTPDELGPAVFSWGQLQRIPKTLSPWWESTRIVDKLLQVIWKPDNVAIKGLAFAWASHRSVVKKINSEFEITQLAESKLRTSWVSHFLAVKQLRTTWTVLGRVQKLLIQQWNQDQRQIKLLTMTWNSTLARVRQLVTEWESTASIPRRLIQEWNSTQILHRRLRATWDSTEIVEKRLRTIYTQLGRIEKKLVVEWDITAGPDQAAPHGLAADLLHRLAHPQGADQPG